ncbi:angiotensin-converting enzyme-like [Saccostrea cucullata]|uniref:angiotensin-converting enzyme-like n=1 Tax=Saccostrea cuccullata TaxID=36930 RepID=UPI002ED414ED
MLLALSIQFLLIFRTTSTDSANIKNETLALKFLIDHDQSFGMLWNIFYKSVWEYVTNVNEPNKKDMNEKSVQLFKFDKEAAEYAGMFAYKNFTNTTMKRQFIKVIERAGLYTINDSTLLDKITRTKTEIRNLQSNAIYCLPREHCLYRAGLEKIMSKSRSHDELLAVWEGWHHMAGRSVKDDFIKLTKLMNKAVKYKGYDDVGEWWASFYEMEYFENDIARLFKELEPLYLELHAYIRKQLLRQYEKDIFPLSGHIPAHLLGSLDSGKLETIYQLIEPFPNISRVDITKKMQKGQFNITLLYRIAEDFYTSLGFEPMDDEFWENSMFVKPTDKHVFCNPSSWDFGDGKDFRIKACTRVDEENLIMAHHEVGHIVYYQSYKLQDTIFRNGANPAFHDGVAGLAALSVNTPEHLHKIGFTETVIEDPERDINYLMKLALEKVALLPYAYAIEYWRWSVFREQLPPSEYNKKWWDFRCRYQGISPPVKRTKEDFDPGAVHHVATNQPFIKHFISVIIQFQWHEALCKVADHKGPLHRCNLYGSRTAGHILKKALGMGSSKPWQNVMRVVTGQRRMSVKPLMKYFSPLVMWLREQNKEENIGWARSCPSITPTSQTSTPLDHPDKYIRYFHLIPPLQKNRIR